LAFPVYRFVFIAFYLIFTKPPNQSSKYNLLSSDHKKSKGTHLGGQAVVTKKRKSTKELPGPVHSLPADLRKAISEKAAIKAAWDSLTPLARNEWICWVISAKKPETRLTRIERTQVDLAAGKKRPCCWPGCPHRRPSAAKWFKSA